MIWTTGWTFYFKDQQFRLFPALLQIKYKIGIFSGILLMNTFTPMSSKVCEVGSDYFPVDYSKVNWETYIFAWPVSISSSFLLLCSIVFLVEISSIEIHIVWYHHIVNSFQNLFLYCDLRVTLNCPK